MSPAVDVVPPVLGGGRGPVRPGRLPQGAPLVAGDDSKRVTDEAWLARFVGRGMLLRSGVTAVFAVAAWLAVGT